MFKSTYMMIVIGLLSSVAATQPADEPLVATGIGLRITLTEFEAMANTQSPIRRKEMKSNSSAQKQFLDRLIEMTLLANEARRRGYGDDPEVLTVKKNQMATLMMEKLTAKNAPHRLSEDELKAYYEQHKDQYHKPARRRARQIVYAQKADAQKTLTRFLKEPPSQYQFRKLANQESIDTSTAPNGGDLSFFSRDGDRGPDAKPVPKQIAQAVFSIEKNGDIYPNVVETEQGFAVLMRTGERAPLNLSFDDARPQLTRQANRMARTKQNNKIIANLTKKANVTLYEENLKHVVIDLSGDLRQNGVMLKTGARRPRKVIR